MTAGRLPCEVFIFFMPFMVNRICNPPEKQEEITE